MTCNNNVPKSASFCGIPEPNRRKPYFHKVRGWFRKMLHFSGGRQGQLEQTDAAQSGDADTSMSPLEPLSPTFMEFPSSELLTAKPLPETLVPTTSELPSELLVPTPPDVDAESLSPASLRSSAVKQLHVIAADSTDDVAVGSFQASTPDQVKVPSLLLVIIPWNAQAEFPADRILSLCSATPQRRRCGEIQCYFSDNLRLFQQFILCIVMLIEV